MNKTYTTREILFYVQWLTQDNRPNALRVKERVPFPIMQYEKVTDERGCPTNVYMRTIITAAEINRPAFVIPRTVLHAGARQPYLTSNNITLYVMLRYLIHCNVSLQMRIDQTLVKAHRSSSFRTTSSPEIIGLYQPHFYGKKTLTSLKIEDKFLRIERSR